MRPLKVEQSDATKQNETTKPRTIRCNKTENETTKTRTIRYNEQKQN